MSVPLEAALPLAEAAAPTELEARRALNAEYLRHHPDEVARFLDERMPSETALIVHDAGPEEAVHLLERLNPRVAADVLRNLPAEAAKIALRQMHPARAAPIVASFEATEREGSYLGPDVSRAARLMSLAHGGQVLVSDATELLLRDRMVMRPLGEHRLKDLGGPESVFQLCHSALPSDFPSLRSPDQEMFASNVSST